MKWLRDFWNAFTQLSAARPHSFTPDAQLALVYAREEAQRLGHSFVGTEHVLLGLIRLGHGLALSALKSYGLELDKLRRAVEKAVLTRTDQKFSGKIAYTPRVKKALALAMKEARLLQQSYVGTEHILLGLLREGDGVAARVLLSLGVNLEKTRQEILEQMNPSNPSLARKFKASQDVSNDRLPK